MNLTLSLWTAPSVSRSSKAASYTPCSADRGKKVPELRARPRVAPSPADVGAHRERLRDSEPSAVTEQQQL